MTTYIHGTESRMFRDRTGTVCSDHPEDWYDNVISEYDAFESIRVLARVDATVSDAGRPVEGPRVSVVPVPNYRGGAQLALMWPSVVQAIDRACVDPNAMYGGRLPGIVGGRVFARARTLGAPFIANVVGDPQAVLESGAGGLIGRLLVGRAVNSMRRQVAQASAVLYVSQQFLQAKYPAALGAPTIARPYLSKAVRLAAEPERFDEPPARLRLAAIGTHEQLYKGHDLVIGAVRALVERGWEVSATLVGDGRFQPELRALADKVGVADRIRFLGQIHDPEEIIRVIDECTIFLMPSRAEGVPRALIEAMARAKPAVGSDVGGIPELLDASAVFPSNDLGALVRLLDVRARDSRWLTAQSMRNRDLIAGFVSPQQRRRQHEFLVSVTRGES